MDDCPTSEKVDAGSGSYLLEKSYAYDRTGNRLSLTEPRPPGGPALALSQTKVYWASYNDYLNRQLSIDYKAANNGPGAAYEAQVTGATATKGVYLTTPVPLPLGDIAQGAYAPFTLKYFVPVGVTGFTTTVYATAKDQAGADYYYPAKRSTYAYIQANQLTSLSDGAGTTDFTYNAAGALTRKTKGEGQTTYNYNGMDKLTLVTTPTATVNYAYDALGRRISRTEGTDTRNYHLNGKSDLEDYQTDQMGTLTSSFLRGPDGLISQTDHSGQTPITTYNLYNPHGDTAALTDTNGTVTGSYRYDSFGNAVGGTPPRYGYTGKWQRDSDSATSTIRMGVREYDPSLGRFTSADPLKGSITDPQQRNRYTYTSNNPLVRYDLNGLFANPLRDLVDWLFGENSQGLPENPSEQVSGAVADFAINYLELQVRSRSDQPDPEHIDWYYHCKANYEATQRGFFGEKAAEIMSWTREEWGTAKGAPEEEYELDMRANKKGRQGCNAGLSLEDACGEFLD